MKGAYKQNKIKWMKVYINIIKWDIYSHHTILLRNWARTAIHFEDGICFHWIYFILTLILTNVFFSFALLLSILLYLYCFSSLLLWLSRVRDQIVADGFDTPLDWQKSGECLSPLFDDVMLQNSCLSSSLSSSLSREKHGGSNVS